MSGVLDYARLLRVPNVFTAMADIALGAFVTFALPGRWGAFLCLLGASGSLYCGGMVWNDYFDLQQDLRERPHRPLASGRVPTSHAVLLGLLLMLIGVGLAALGGGPVLPIAGLLVLAIFLYDAWLKRTGFGPIAMGSCRFLNILLGLSVTGEAIPGWGYWLALVVGVYITGVTWFARTEARVSNAILLQSAAGVMLAGLVMGLAVPALALNQDPNIAVSTLFPYLLVAFFFFVGQACYRAIRQPQPRYVQQAVKRSVLGLVLFDAILACSVVGWGGLLIGLLLVPAYFLGQWVYST